MFCMGSTLSDLGRSGCEIRTRLKGYHESFLSFLSKVLVKTMKSIEVIANSCIDKN